VTTYQKLINGTITPLAIVKQWVEALRSGQYEQGKGNLNKNGKFCCLGVLCELLELEKGFDESGEGKTIYILPSGQESGTWLPGDLGNSFKLNEDSPSWLRWQGYLANLNDGRPPSSYGEPGEEPKTFQEIADVIEANIIPKLQEGS
jgi:hypothetical protein